MNRIESADPPSLLLVTNIPNHYRIPLFNELADQLRAQLGLELVVLFAAETYSRRRDVGRSSGLDNARFEWRFMKTVIVGHHRPLFLPLGLRREIRSIKPKAILVGGTGMLALVGIIVAKTQEIPLIIWSGETKRGSTTVRKLKAPVKKLILSKASAAVSYGSASAEFISELAPHLAVFTGWNTTDLAPFLTNSLTPESSPTSELELVTVGDLTHVKGHRYLFEALCALEPALLRKVELKVVGDGPLRRELEETSRSLGLENHIKFRGAIAAEEVPSALAPADVFVFPSLGDVWGLALLEAMAAGLPVVASDRAGATRDLVIPEAGFVVDPTDVAQFGNALEKMLKLSQAERVEMGVAARAFVVEKCSLQNSAAGFVRAFRHALR